MKNPQTLMVQGTTSDAGKSVLVAAICRILARRGHSVAPFKPQNMALNSAVTAEGGEIGRAQAVQAAACYLEPSVLMNPVLLKPASDTGAQVIVRGKAIGNMEAGHYHHDKPGLLNDVLDAFTELQEQYQLVLVEGAGSPAEINLRDRDIANMGFAEVADCPVIIVADIDRGGVFAHLVGTYELLSETEKQRIKGFVINRFRGDIALLQSGLEWLEQRCGVPVLGVIPYIQDLYIEAEDAIDARQNLSGNEAVKVTVPVYPRASNHTDFDVLRLHPMVDLEYIRDPEQFQGADLIILPGSKSVRDDLAWLRKSGWENVIQKHLRFGGKLIGVCGGFQMLGKKIHDPDGIESAPGSSNGLGLLAMETTLAGEKILRNVAGSSHAGDDITVRGYEIHAGCSQGEALEKPWFTIAPVDQPRSRFDDGALADDNQVRGSYIHGLFDRSEVLDEVIRWCGVDAVERFDYQDFRDRQLDYLADCVESAVSYRTWCRLLAIEPDN